MDVGAVNDAVSHFSKHIKYYKTLPTDQDKEFLHFAWLARQYVTLLVRKYLLIPP
jgi:hypothetical protein